MALPLEKVVIPADGLETMVWLQSFGDLSDDVFYHRIKLFVLLDRPVRHDGSPQVGICIPSYIARYERK